MSQIDAVDIPDKNRFKIGEVAKLLDLEPHVLRYWEGEFDELAPDKTDSGQRIYRREDIEFIVQIRQLLYEQMFTIAGARRQFERYRKGEPCLLNASWSESEEADEALADRLEELRQQNARLQEERAQLAEELAEHEETRQPE
ncbi:MAG: MerR family transcriptional regulator, partial [Persicimonas sp.]